MDFFANWNLLSGVFWMLVEKLFMKVFSCFETYLALVPNRTKNYFDYFALLGTQNYENILECIFIYSIYECVCNVYLNVISHVNTNKKLNFSHYSYICKLSTRECVYGRNKYWNPNRILVHELKWYKEKVYTFIC